MSPPHKSIDIGNPVWTITIIKKIQIQLTFRKQKKKNDRKKNGKKNGNEKKGMKGTYIIRRKKCLGLFGKGL